MTQGKEKCRILKQIREAIAKANDIEFVTSQCTHKGDCKGTCPKCEAEVRYLEAELRKKKQRGMKVAVAGIMGSLVAVMPGCGCKTANGGSVPNHNYRPDTPATAVQKVEKKAACADTTGSEEIILMGEVPAEDPHAIDD